MNLAFSHITALLLAIHGVFGCGWHHVHVCDEHDASAHESADAENCVSHSCHDAFLPCHTGSSGHSATEQSDHSHPCQDQCHGPSCVFAPPASRSEFRGVETDAYATAPGLTLSEELARCTARRLLQIPFPDTATGPRTHLVLQVLLI